MRFINLLRKYMNADSYQKQDIKSSLLVEDDLYNNR